jgi:hypothetical protein
MPAAVEFRQSVVGRFNELLRIELAKRGEEQVRPRDLREAVIEQCMKLAQPYYRELVEAKLDQQAGWLLQRLRPPKEEAVPDLLPGFVLPYRIPVPSAGSAVDEAMQRWTVLHKATVGEFRRHRLDVTRDYAARGKYVDTVNLIWATVEPLSGGDDSRIIGDLLRSGGNNA